MSNDLISRKVLLEELKSFSMTITGLNNPTSRFIADQCKKSIMRIVEEQPTAYDVDKVVEQLEEKSKDETCAGDGTMRADDAIEIVKAGGIE